VSLDDKKGLGKKDRKWCYNKILVTLKNLHPIAQTIDLLKRVKINIKVK
jgi:hypothetical protein